jgi:hypothetical protein
MNRVTTWCLSLVLLSLVVTPVLAANPTPGTYFSIDLGGTVQLGRGTQSWELPLNQNQGLADVFNAQSWDGVMLATQWRFSCGVQSAAQSVTDHRDGAGNGTVIFDNTFLGGTFFLSKSGPWGDGVNDLTGTIQTTHALVTVVYVDHVPVQSRLNFDSSGLFDGSGCALRFVVANGVGGGDTDLMPVPPNFPAFLDPGCGPTRTNGSWGDIKDITLRIDCPVNGRSSTWGALKTSYR